MVTILCTVYGKKPAQKQKDHREQLIANHKPVEKMAGRRMVRPPLPFNNKAYNCPACHDSPSWARGRRWAC